MQQKAIFFSRSSFISFLLCLANALQTFSQSGWERIQPCPTDEKINDASFIDGLTGWFACNGNEIWKTADGGITYSQIASPYTGTDIDWFNIAFTDVNNGWIYGTGGIIEHTNDGGLTWQPQQSGTACVDVKMQFTDNLHGRIALTYDSILVTNDGGNSWIKYEVASGLRYPEMFFLDKDIGWIASDSIRIFKTVDGGVTWNSSIINPNIRIRDIHFIDSLNGWAIGDSTFTIYELSNILRTYDGGQTWVKLVGSIGIQFENVHFVDSLNGFFFGRQAYLQIYSTHDGGNSFLNVTPPPMNSREVPTILHAKITPDGNGFAYGWFGAMYKSSTNGDVWTKSFSSANNGQFSSNISFPDSMHGWMCDAYGFIFKTSDGGMNWTEISVANHPVIGGELCFLDTLNGWIAGRDVNHYCAIAKTTDGGYTWTQMLTTTFDNYPIMKIDAWNKNNITAVQIYGNVFTSHDGGSSWTHAVVPASGTFAGDIQMLDSLNIWVSFWDGTNTNFHHSSDGGVTWNTELSGFNNLCFSITSSNLYYVAARDTGLYPNHNFLWKTNDAGLSWSKIFFPPDLPQIVIDGAIRCVQFTDSLNGWVAGGSNDDHGSFILYTPDGGNTWSLQEYGETYEWEDLIILNSQVGYASGIGGAFEKSSQATYIGIHNIEVPHSLISLSNYPNPSQFFTTIKFELQNQSVVTLEIFDLLGNKCLTLFENSLMQEGIHEIPFFTNTLNRGGIYHYRITADGSFATGSMIVIQ